MVNITAKTLTNNTKIIANVDNDSVKLEEDKPSFKDRLYSLCNTILPTTNYWDSTTPLNQLPSAFVKDDGTASQYLCSRNQLLSDIASILDNDSTVSSNLKIESNSTYEIIKNVFMQLGRCKKVSIKEVSGTGDQILPPSLSKKVKETKWAYFKKQFQFSSNYTSNEEDLPQKKHNSNTDVTKYSSDPLGSVGWNNNTTYSLSSSKISTMTVNNLIKAIENVEKQMQLFSNEENSVNNSNVMWNGSYSNPNGSNRITFVKYWCHSNCHCHSSGRSKR